MFIKQSENSFLKVERTVQRSGENVLVDWMAKRPFFCSGALCAK